MAFDPFDPWQLLRIITFGAFGKQAVKFQCFEKNPTGRPHSEFLDFCDLAL